VVELVAEVQVAGIIAQDGVGPVEGGGCAGAVGKGGCAAACQGADLSGGADLADSLALAFYYVEVAGGIEGQAYGVGECG
ncbi:hypothetical protein, partial [Pararcticibacter amylolyticus]|uniref:hypothetical protein n=1 Tax=Pararcticibacter amylolyticus TaxID=2173175 RepID=UPI001EE3B220